MKTGCRVAVALLRFKAGLIGLNHHPRVFVLHQKEEGESGLRGDLCRLARFGANIADAHSCFIFVPRSVLQSGGAGEESLVLGGYHSFSADVFREYVLPRGSGLIGWVAKHNRSIHVSPFERDSRTLGVYSADQQLKSFIGIPIRLVGGVLGSDEPLVGVVACDSKKAFAFSKVQGKLLEDLAAEVAREVQLTQKNDRQGSYALSWEGFLHRAGELMRALGGNAVEVLRIRQTNLGEMERALGLGPTIQTVEQIVRLIQQTLPPHFPLIQLPSGEMVLVVDNMMTSFYEGKIRAICSHVSTGSRQKIVPEFEFLRSSTRRRRGETLTLEQLIATTNPLEVRAAAEVHGEVYGYRRA